MSPVTIIATNKVGDWNELSLNTFQNDAPHYHRHAYRKTFLGEGFCVNEGHLEGKLTMHSATKENNGKYGGNHWKGVEDRGNYAGIAMRADSATNQLGYQCQIDAKHQTYGIKMTRNGKHMTALPRNDPHWKAGATCMRLDMSDGVANRWTTTGSKHWTMQQDSLCSIQERNKAFAPMFHKDTPYDVRMEVKNSEAIDGGLDVACFVDGEIKLWWTDPYPLKGGEFLIDSKYQSTFQLTDYTDTKC